MQRYTPTHFSQAPVTSTTLSKSFHKVPQKMLQNIQTSLLEERVKRVVPTEQSQSWFYSMYFLVPKKGRSTSPQYSMCVTLRGKRLALAHSIMHANVCKRIGEHSRGQISKWVMGPTSGQSPHKLSGNAVSFSDADAFSPISKGAPCSCENGQHNGGGIYKPSGRSQINPLAHVGTHDTVGQCQPLISESDSRTEG